MKSPEYQNVACPIGGLHDINVDQLARYKLAWDHLLHIPAATPEQRAHAYVWLGHRVIDGQMKHEDWSNEVTLPAVSFILALARHLPLPRVTRIGRHG